MQKRLATPQNFDGIHWLMPVVFGIHRFSPKRPRQIPMNAQCLYKSNGFLVSLANLLLIYKPKMAKSNTNGAVSKINLTMSLPENPMANHRNIMIFHWSVPCLWHAFKEHGKKTLTLGIEMPWKQQRAGTRRLNIYLKPF